MSEEFLEDDTNDTASEESEDLDDLDSQGESEEELSEDKLSVFSLNTPENIICWSKVRDFLKVHYLSCQLT